MEIGNKILKHDKILLPYRGLMLIGWHKSCMSIFITKDTFLGKLIKF